MNVITSTISPHQNQYVISIIPTVGEYKQQCQPKLQEYFQQLIFWNTGNQFTTKFLEQQFFHSRHSFLTRTLQIISRESYLIMNPYQIPQQIIFYYPSECIITDLSHNLLYKKEIEFIDANMQVEHYCKAIANIMRIQNRSALLHTKLCNGLVYVILDNGLFEINLFTVKEILQIPLTKQTNFNMLCVHQHKLLVCDSLRVYEVENRWLHLFPLQHELNQQPGLCLLSFGTHSILIYKVNYQTFWAEITSHDSLSIIYYSEVCNIELNQSGLIVAIIDGCGTRIVMDLTQEQIKIRFDVRNENGSQDLYQLHKQFLEFSDEEMQFLIPEYKEFKLRQYDALQAHIVDEKGFQTFNGMITRLTKFKRPQFPFLDSRKQDIFLLETNLFIQFEKILQTKYQALNVFNNKEHNPFQNCMKRARLEFELWIHAERMGNLRNRMAQNMNHEEIMVLEQELQFEMHQVMVILNLNPENRNNNDDNANLNQQQNDNEQFNQQNQENLLDNNPFRRDINQQEESSDHNPFLPQVE